jgi:hypothetical protein
MPCYDLREVQSTAVQAPPARVFLAIKEVTPSEIRLVRALMGIRALMAQLTSGGSAGFAGAEPLLSQALHSGFLLRAEAPDRELVLRKCADSKHVAQGNQATSARMTLRRFERQPGVFAPPEQARAIHHKQEHGHMLRINQDGVHGDGQHAAAR